MVKKFSIFLTFLILFSFVTSISYAQTKNIKVSVDTLPGETDVSDNKREIQVNVVEQGFDLPPI